MIKDSGIGGGVDGKLHVSAIDKDPDFAPAHAGLVQSYVLNLLWGFAAARVNVDGDETKVSLYTVRE